MEYNITYRQKDKGWQYIISYKDNEGKWKQKSKQGFKTRALAKLAADDRLDEMKEDAELKKKLSAEYENITFKEFMEMYIEHKKIHREYNSVRVLKFALNKFKDLDDTELKDITNIQIQNCVDKIVKEKLAYNTLNSYVSNIKCAFNFAKERNIIIDNPFSNITIPQNKNSTENNVLTKSELEDLLSKIQNRRYKMIATIAGTCGLRIGEIAGLTWGDIDFNNALMTVNKQWKELEKGKWGYGTVKRKLSNRTVPIPPMTLQELARYKADIPVHFTNRVFYQNKNVLNLGQNLSNYFKKIGYDITVHNLRHTYATILVQNGVDFKTVAKLMGHDVEQTLRTYSHVNDDMMNRATNALKSIFN